MTTETSNARGWVVAVGDGSEFDIAMRAYEFAAIRHGKTGDNAPAVDAAGARVFALFNAAAAPPPAAARGDVRIIARDIHYAIMDDGLAPLSNADNHKIREAILRVLQAALAAEGVQAGEVEDSETAWREGWAMAYSGADHLYGDDGELQDNRWPCIDWRRDSALEIRRKIEERGNRAWQAQLSQQPMQQGGGEDNQCDGCCAGYGERNGIHVLPDGTTYMACQSGRYAPPSAPVGVEAMPGLRRELAGIVRRDDAEMVSIEPNEAAAIFRALAQQPAAVDEAAMDRAELAFKTHPFTDCVAHRESLRAAVAAALATQHQEPTT